MSRLAVATDRRVDAWQRVSSICTEGRLWYHVSRRVGAESAGPFEVKCVVRADGQTVSPLRDLELLDGERVEYRFVPGTGQVPETPGKGQLLVLTTHRIVSFGEGSDRVSVAPVAELEGVTVKANVKGLQDLFQGLFLMVAGLLIYIIVGYILDGIAIALALGAAIAFAGALFVAKHLLWEEDGSVTFLAGAWQASFTYRRNRASSDLHRLIDRCFQMKLGVAEAVEEELEPEEAAPEAEEPSLRSMRRRWRRRDRRLLLPSLWAVRMRWNRQSRRLRRRSPRPIGIR